MTDERKGWDLVVSRPLTQDQRRRADDLAAIELGRPEAKKSRRKRGEGGERG